MFPNKFLLHNIQNPSLQSPTNPGHEFDEKWISESTISKWAIDKRAKQIPRLVQILESNEEYEIAWLLRAVTCIDLTTLAGDDTRGNVTRLCYKARLPVREDLLKKVGFESDDILTAAVCVYPARIKDALSAISEMGEGCPLEIAAVATGFPSGQYSIKTRLEEIKTAVADGATEIDVVIDRSLALSGQWEKLYDELKLMKVSCGSAKMKTILAVGELPSFTHVYRASVVAMLAGSDFIKTSTGKEAVNATLPVGLVMARAIADYHKKTGYRVGLKAAGGIRTSSDALAWLILAQQELNGTWQVLDKSVFRIGASALLTAIEKRIHKLINGYIPQDYQLLQT